MIASEDINRLLSAIAETPETVAKLTKDFSDQDLRTRNSLEEFSALENFCHLRDIEIDGYETRIKRILTETNPSLADIDGSRLAAERDYNHQDPQAALQDFASARSRNVRTLKTLSAEQFDRQGQLEGVGIVTIRKLLEMMNQHDQDHLRDLTIISRRLKPKPSAENHPQITQITE